MPSQPPFWQHAIQTTERLTRLEITTEDHDETLDSHEKRHDEQDMWNKAFTVALLGLGSGLAHAKAGDVLDLALALLRQLRG